MPVPKRFALYGEYAEALRFMVELRLDGRSGRAGGIDDEDAVVVEEDIGAGADVADVEVWLTV